MSATVATDGRVHLYHPLASILSLCLLRASIRQIEMNMAHEATVVSPSAASTQVVPNGGKGRKQNGNVSFSDIIIREMTPNCNK